MEKYRYITLMEKPELKEEAASWFHSKWGVPKEAYFIMAQLSRQKFYIFIMN